MNEDQGSASMIRVFGQLLMLPIAAFVYGVEMLIKTMQGVQQVSNQGMEVMVGPQAQRAKVSKNDLSRPALSPGC